ncbi:glycosyltransferase family 2 protein [Hydromonas duriensis]|uniref:Glycosyltransferase involved in cell wall biosynthesis n=1 Tax=Hydromonas duriensis TaxID=1527608 RepID=A0A4R6YAF5_9BURK|nr:glycosyltransferase family 2 protein [Hydromonas duriensis]TDR32547.1 glycosyltransferase involved in cell wall biosynthesis [Hydromonas duriensis]
MPNTPFKISCIVPAHNESSHIEAFIAALTQTLSAESPHVEIIVVNDGSTDNTEAIVQKLLHHYPIRYLSLSRNFGKEAALSAGIAFADGDVTLLIDADFQHPLELVPEMFALWRSGFDMAYGVINDRSDESTLKRWGSNVLYKLLDAKNSKFSIPRNAGDFRLMDRKVVEALQQLPERNRFMKGLYAWVGYKSAALPFRPAPRAGGESSFNAKRLFGLAVTGITSFSSLPLRVSGVAGIVISLAAFIYALYIAWQTLVFGNEVPGWATLTVGMMFFSGVQLILIGVLGEYVGQIYEEVKKRPLYLIDKNQASPMLTNTPSQANEDPSTH